MKYEINTASTILKEQCRTNIKVKKSIVNAEIELYLFIWATANFYHIFCSHFHGKRAGLGGCWGRRGRHRGEQGHYKAQGC